MNERIKLLAEQAGMTDDKFGMYFAKDKHNEDGVDLEKFAELIVRECIELCKKQEYDYWRSSEEQDYTPIDCANAIEEHFGVEE